MKKYENQDSDEIGVGSVGIEGGGFHVRWLPLCAAANTKSKRRFIFFNLQTVGVFAGTNGVGGGVGVVIILPSSMSHLQK